MSSIKIAKGSGCYQCGKMFTEQDDVVLCSGYHTFASFRCRKCHKGDIIGETSKRKSEEE